jgi:ornithine carbamoyltransferase
MTAMKTKRDFLSFWDLSATELLGLIRRAEELRFLRSIRAPHATRPGRVLAMIFEKASTRTRVSFEAAIFDLGGHGIVLGKNDSQIGRGEPVRDTARVLSGYCHAVMVRTFGQDTIEELARYASIPIINGLTDLLHPCQVLADLQTVYAHHAGAYGRAGNAPAAKPAVTAPDVLTVLRQLRYAWIGDGNNMANSWIEAAGMLGLDLALAYPPGYEPDGNVLEKARASGQGRITTTNDPREAADGRHVISTDVFASMGQEAEAEARRRDFAKFCVDAALMDVAEDDAIVLHCLPAHRGEEISDDVIEGPQSRVFQQAENRLHAQKALLEWILA